MNCKRCGARLPRGMAICPECGARQRQQAGRIRCAQCGKRALADLTVCPHCGRTLRPAGPRWGLWLTGAVAIVLAGMMTLNRLPVRAAWQQAVNLQERLSSVVQIPELPAAPSPAAAARNATTPTATASRTPASTPRASSGLSVTLTVIRPPATSSPTQAAGTPAAGSPTAGSQAAPQAPTATATPVPASPTPTAAPPTATAAPTETPAPTATPTTDTVRYYTVKTGDTFIDIGNATGFPWEQIAAVNGMTASSLILPGMKLKLPGAGSSQPPTGPTATPAGARKYRVQAGDTLTVIGQRFGISWQSIAQANGLTASSVLQVGQELTIPSN